MIVITGATGQLGRLVVEALLDKLPAEQIVAAVRSPEKAADLAERGVTVRKADYDDPETLASALAGADKVLLVSSNDVGRRVAQHRAVVEAAKAAEVSHLVYTSASHADTSALVLAPDHKVTEEIIAGSGLAYTFLRNNWYNENYVPTIEHAAKTGGFFGSVGEGRVASASRADYAAATVVVLTGTGHENKVYELSGDVAWTSTELAAEIARATGRKVGYTDLSPEEHAEALIKAGTPEGATGFMVALEGNIKDGLLSETSGDLRALTGRPTTPIADTVAEVAKVLYQEDRT